MYLITNRKVLHLLAMAAFLHICQARSLDNGSATDESTNDTLWQPKDGTREEWVGCRGMAKDVCERTKTKKQELQKILAKKLGLDHVANDSSYSDSGVNQCIMFTEEQLDMMITEAKKEEEKTTSTHRKKRTLINHKKYPSYKWSMPVHYMFDGTHDNSQKAKIRRAFQHWADNTCIRFEELSMNARFNSNFIIIENNEDDGCWSRLGRIPNKPGIPQQINLAPYCVEAFGTLVHEIGHSLGLVHEHSRFGRNDSVRVLWSNIEMDEWPQYAEASYTDALGLPYTYGSVMHYSTNGFSKNGGDTMYAVDSLYRKNMGQRVDLSFHDKKIINLGYCKGSCKTPLSQPCQRGGYQNPNKCSTCICPDGFSGQYCNEIASSQNAECGGEVLLNIASGTQQVITSPGYATRGYSGYQECTWWIKAPKNYTLELAFTDSFDIYCGGASTCRYHWVEIKYKKDLGLEGARFCCDKRPSDTVVSEFNEMMVIFRSNYSIGSRRPRGFKAIVKSTPNGHRKSLFRCSFEKTTSSRDSLCGMTQGTNDQFDWTVHHNATPSIRTGPDFPYDGDFYIYIDANWPRKLNDEAKLFFPKLNFVGETCISFYYHMFGSNVKNLKLFRINKFRSTDIWTKSGQIENNWMQASVGVYLSRCSQLQFVGIRGDGNFGDIGLDKIEVKSGPCAF